MFEKFKNNMQPFNSAPADVIKDSLLSLVLDKNEQKNDGDAFWIEEGRNFVALFVDVMVWHRDHNQQDISPESFAKNINYIKFKSIAQNEKMPSDLQERSKKYFWTLETCSNATDEDAMKQQHLYRAMCLIKPLEYLGVDSPTQYWRG